MLWPRATGFAMLSAASVQEAQDFSLIAHAATLESRVQRNWPKRGSIKATSVLLWSIQDQ
jgi:hypothetical protein